ncbi:hypothetical protein HJG60_009309 [Phyllostomus discolor]|uniref:Uncharacterized protein n=1 Tax=Phyllostomus discolor TaxID=89673 RepID=A0A833Y8R5_9CHIR|nr:hypothetical protein HJG60_009309 [Phyllostomus discolor]
MQPLSKLGNSSSAWGKALLYAVTLTLHRADGGPRRVIGPKPSGESGQKLDGALSRRVERPSVPCGKRRPVHSLALFFLDSSILQMLDKNKRSLPPPNTRTFTYTQRHIHRTHPTPTRVPHDRSLTGNRGAHVVTG